jgi:hypothetical protein
MGMRGLRFTLIFIIPQMRRCLQKKPRGAGKCKMQISKCKMTVKNSKLFIL